MAPFCLTFTKTNGHLKHTTTASLTFLAPKHPLLALPYKKYIISHIKFVFYKIEEVFIYYYYIEILEKPIGRYHIVNLVQPQYHITRSRFHNTDYGFKKNYNISYEIIYGYKYKCD